MTYRPQFVRSRTMMLSIGIVAATSMLLAQAPAPVATPPVPQAARPTSPTAARRLPVQRVVLYKSGVGYFEHVGRVQGNQTVSIDFTSGQLDDVLKSLTTLDLDGGRVTSVSYNSTANLERRLGTLRVPVGEQASRAQLLGALRGARLDVRGVATPISGRLLSVEQVERRRDGGSVVVDAVSIITDGGEVHTIALDPGVSVRIAENDLNQDIGRYLTLLASERNQDVRQLSIATTGAGARDLYVSYVSEVPVWKSTYRLVLPADGSQNQPLLQGWAIVDNVGEEDWSNVELSLVAGAPQSFVQNVSQPLYVRRPVVPLADRSMMAPQTHQGGTNATGAGVLTGIVMDSEGTVIPGATVTLNDVNGVQVGRAITSSDGRYRIANVPSGRYTASYALSGFRTITRPNVAIAPGVEANIDVRLQVGALSETVTVSAGSSAFRSSNITLDGVMSSRIDEARGQQQVAAEAVDLGDLFEYKLRERVTIGKNQSALVPIVSGNVTAERVSLWNPSNRSARPLRAVWITNSTGLTLDGGSLAVIDGQAFAGEGLVDPIKPGARRLLSYATDLGLTVTGAPESTPAKITRVQASRGVLRRTTEERQRWVYTARNEDAAARVLVIEHPVQSGWMTNASITAAETTPASLRYRVTVAPKSTATFTVDQSRPLVGDIEIASITDDVVALLVKEQSISPEIESALRGVLSRKAALAQLTSALATPERRIQTIDSDQQRLRSNMQALKGSTEERQLVQRYVRQLDEQENELATLRKEQAALRVRITDAEAELAKFIESIASS